MKLQYHFPFFRLAKTNLTKIPQCWQILSATDTVTHDGSKNWPNLYGTQLSIAMKKKTTQNQYVHHLRPGNATPQFPQTDVSTQTKEEWTIYKDFHCRVFVIKGLDISKYCLKKDCYDVLIYWNTL